MENKTIFKKRFKIVQRHLTPKTKRRSGILIPDAGVKFVVAHDTGNPGSTARGNVKYYESSKNEISASAHLFVDDKEIIECIPAIMAPPEKAWHVIKGPQIDNLIYGAEANDAAIGVEYCYGGAIDAEAAYARYVWVLAYLCYIFRLDPAKSVVGHSILDPARKTDPDTGLSASGRLYEQLIMDVPGEFAECLRTTTIGAQRTTTTALYHG